MAVLPKKGKAYVCELKAEQIAAKRYTTPDRTVPSEPFGAI